MTRPPYLRRAAALTVFILALVIELRPTTTDVIPVASSPLTAGSEVTDEDVRWLQVEPGVQPINLPAVLARDVASGSPITPSDLDSAATPIPDDWLRIELQVPDATANGNPVIVVLPVTVTDLPVPGIVVAHPSASDFEGPSALVAFAPGDAVSVARGLAEGQVTVLLGR